MFRPVATVAVVSLLLASAVAAPAAGASGVDGVDEPALHVAVTADGEATISLLTVHDLTDDDERSAFESLEDDEQAQRELRDRFEDRMESVAEGSAEDGAAAITDASIEVRSEDERGIVAVSVTWDDFADVDDGTLVVAEPFASGFEADRRLVVTGPDGSTIESAAPDPTATDGARASWAAGTDLDGFEVVISLDADGGHDAGADESAEGAVDGTPGFGAGAALAVLGLGLGAATTRVRSGRARKPN